MINNLICEIKKRYLFYLIFFTFQLVSFFLWNKDFGGYLFNTYLVFIFVIFEQKKISYFFGLIALFAMVFYATLSFYYKDPNKLYREGDNVKEGKFIIDNSYGKGTLRGDLAVYGQNPLEDFNYDGFIFYNKNIKVYVVMSCSLLQESCFFHDRYGDLVDVKYVEDQSRFWYKNNYYIFQIKYKDAFIGDIYFLNRYERERLNKIYFIVFYLLVNIIFLNLKVIKLKLEKLNYVK